MKKITLLLIVLLLGGGIYRMAPGSAKERLKPEFKGSVENLKDIYFAGGCFWGVEHYFSLIPGVYDASSGYANGNTANPSYEDVCTRNTGHAETVRVRYDPAIVSLKTLTEHFFKIIDPTTSNRQGNDVGRQYRSGVYYVDKSDLPTLEAVFGAERKKHSKPVTTELLPLQNFYMAEEYHQDYLVKNPKGYCHVDFSTLDELPVEQKSPTNADYVRPSSGDLKKKLTPIQYDVTQNCGTEAPFTGEYWNNKKRGIYVDVVTGEPLFLSVNKFDSGSGWPSFTKPIDKNAVTEREDTTMFMKRTEVRSNSGDSHLGHVFNDGPKEEGGLRYCINSAALRFVPYDDMEKEGYGEYKKLIN